MAINATAVWRIRAGGNAANGGGYDAAISGAATDYTDQDAAQLSITDGATSGAGSTTLTSAAAGFTAAMVGNCIRIGAGTNFQTGYYFVTAFGSSSSVTLDRTPSSGGAGSGGTGKIGGAFAHIGLSLATGGGGTQPAITSPLAAGHTIYLRGAGTLNPSTMDYTETSGYWQFPAGDTTSGQIKLIGYNGRPGISCDGLMLYTLLNWSVSHIKFKAANTTNGTNGIINGSGPSVTVSDCIFDQAGNDIIGIQLCNVFGNWFTNGGSTTAGTRACLSACPSIRGNVIDGWVGYAMAIVNEDAQVNFNIIANCKDTTHGAIEVGTTSVSIHTTISSNTIYGNASDGIKVTVAAAMVALTIVNNNICSNGGYGLNVSVGSAALNDRTFGLSPDYNNFYNNTTAARHNVSAGAHDLALDPQFTGAVSGDYSIGTNLKAAGFPGVFASALVTGYLDMGAVQRQEAGSGSGARRSMNY